MRCRLDRRRLCDDLEMRVRAVEGEGNRISFPMLNSEVFSTRERISCTARRRSSLSCRSPWSRVANNAPKVRKRLL